MDAEKIGKVIKDCRKEKGMTQKELAEKLMISDKTISKWGEGSWMSRYIFFSRAFKNIRC